jgi:hypothetical protein
VLSVPAADELVYLGEPLKPLPGSRAAKLVGTNRPPRLTEAELVRLHRDGLDPATARARQSETPAAVVVFDPALARALDILKGLALIQSRKP